MRSSFNTSAHFCELFGAVTLLYSSADTLTHSNTRNLTLVPATNSIIVAGNEHESSQPNLLRNSEILRFSTSVV